MLTVEEIVLPIYVLFNKIKSLSKEKNQCLKVFFDYNMFKGETIKKIQPDERYWHPEKKNNWG